MIVSPGSTSVLVYITVLDANGDPLATADNTTLTLWYLREGASDPVVTRIFNRVKESLAFSKEEQEAIEKN